AKALLEAWQVAHPGKTPPGPDPCPACGGGPIDPVDRWYEVLASRIATVKPTDANEIAAIRAEVNDLRQFAIARGAGQKGRTILRLPPARFTKVPVEISQERAEAKARAKAVAAMKADGALLKALPGIQRAIPHPVLPATVQVR